MNKPFRFMSLVLIASLALTAQANSKTTWGFFNKVSPAPAPKAKKKKKTLAKKKAKAPRRARKPVLAAKPKTVVPAPTGPARAGTEIDVASYREILSNMNQMTLIVDGYRINLGDVVAQYTLAQEKRAVAIRNTCLVGTAVDTYDCRIAILGVLRKAKRDNDTSMILNYQISGRLETGLHIVRNEIFLDNPQQISRLPSLSGQASGMDIAVYRAVLLNLNKIILDYEGYQMNLAKFLSLTTLSRVKTAIAIKNSCELQSKDSYSCTMTVTSVLRRRNMDVEHEHTLIYNAGGSPETGIALARRIRSVNFQTSVPAQTSPRSNGKKKVEPEEVGHLKL